MWRYNQADFDLAAEMINNTDWDSLLSDSVDISWKNWQSKYMEIMHNCIPQVTAKSKKSLPWINKQILQAIAKRNACYRLLKSTECHSIHHKYKSLRNKVVGLIREEKRKYFENLNSPDQKVFWKAVKMLNKSTSSIPTLAVQNGFPAATSNDKATILNQYFFLAALTNVSLPCQMKITCLPPLHLFLRRS